MTGAYWTETPMEYPTADEHIYVGVDPTRVPNAIRQQLLALVLDRDALRAQVAGLAAERDALRAELAAVVAERNELLKPALAGETGA